MALKIKINFLKTYCKQAAKKIKTFKQKKIIIKI